MARGVHPAGPHPPSATTTRTRSTGGRDGIGDKQYQRSRQRSRHRDDHRPADDAGGGTRTRLKSRLTSEQSQVTTLQSLNTRSPPWPLGHRAGQDLQLEGLSATSTDRVTATASTGALRGGVTMTVNSLAVAHRLTYTSAAALTDTVVTNGTDVKLTVGSTTTSLTTDGTLQGLASAINAPHLVCRPPSSSSTTEPTGYSARPPRPAPRHRSSLTDYGATAGRALPETSRRPTHPSPRGRPVALVQQHLRRSRAGPSIDNLQRRAGQTGHHSVSQDTTRRPRRSRASSPRSTPR